MKRVGLTLKLGQRELAPLSEKLIGWLKERDLQTAVDGDAGPGLQTLAAPLTGPDYAAQDLIIVLGGDGTLLHAARQVGLSGVPLLGVNLGGLGFLTAVSIDELFPTLEMILAGQLAPQERMRLKVEVIRDDQIIFQRVVLNDVVLNKGAVSRIVDLSADIDGEHLTDYRADGLIIATPTGSTAYNLSAGGPILHPTLAAVILTPICPFTLANRPLVVADRARITVQLGRHVNDVHLACDGQEDLPLTPEDQVVITRGQNLKLFPSPFQDHFSILRTKLGWGLGGEDRPC